MRVGILAYRTATGLSYQCRSYWKHLPVTKVMAINLSGLNGMPLVHSDWYPEAQTVNGYPRDEHLAEFLNDIDVVLLAETPLNYNLYSLARARGIKTAVAPNMEFFDHFVHPEYPTPDLFIVPSVWKYDECKAYADSVGVKCVQLHHPVDREEFPFRLRTTKKFIHIAGNPAVYDRNGTWDALKAVPNLTILTQNEHLAKVIRSRHRNARVVDNVDDNKRLYDQGDILIFPRRYGGNCLPLNEALSSGIPVVMPDILPNNNILPKEWLVPAKPDGYFEPRTRVDLYSIDIEALIEKIKWFEACDIRAESMKADAIADSISWDNMKNKYIQALESL